MKDSFSNILRAAMSIVATLAVPTFAQVSGLTDPVGSMKLNVAGPTGGATHALSFKGLGLTRAIEYQGSAETCGTNTLVDNDATWAENQFNSVNGAYFVEITSGPGTGTTYDISATSATNKRLTLAQNLATGVVAPAKFKVRKHWTFASVFGPSNQFGLAGGDEASVADQILRYESGAYQTYFYQVAAPAAGGTGWRNANDAFTDVANWVIYPDDGLVIKRIQSASINIRLLGSVKMGQTSVPILPGQNLIGNVYGAPMTLASSGLYTGNPATGMAGGSTTSSDQVLLWNGVGYDTYYYQTAGLGGIGWRRGGAPTIDASGSTIPVGASVIVKRNISTGFNWVISQHPSNL